MPGNRNFVLACNRARCSLVSMSRGKGVLTGIPEDCRCVFWMGMNLGQEEL